MRNIPITNYKGIDLTKSIRRYLRKFVFDFVQEVDDLLPYDLYLEN